MVRARHTAPASTPHGAPHGAIRRASRSHTARLTEPHGAPHGAIRRASTGLGTALVGLGEGGREVVDAGLVGCERTSGVVGRGQAALNGLAGCPVLTVGEVPEVHGV